MNKGEAVPANYYATLQVHPRADIEVIESAYHALMAKHRFTPRAQAITEAYQVLSNQFARKDYDTAASRIEGTVIGDFRVLKPIAEGAFGTTYLGEHVRNHEPVCIKQCSRISPESEAILVNESKAMWDLRHFAIPVIRNLIPLDDGGWVLVMSYIPGPTLQQIIAKNGRMDPEHVAWIAQRLLNGLYYMHVNGVINGDVKPSNIIIQPKDHTVVMIDFGLAMIKPRPDEYPIGCTPVFASPEQVKRKTLLPESDLYSLGMTMIYALSGDLEKTRNQEVPNDVPEPLCEFIAELVQPEPLDRPRVWQNDNLCDRIETVRQAAFGRTNSGMKPLDIKV